jgi:hypothetical protein
LQGIDKIAIRFIIEVWGKVGKKGNLGHIVTNSARQGRLGSFWTRQRGMLVGLAEALPSHFNYKPYCYFVNTLQLNKGNKIPE